MIESETDANLEVGNYGEIGRTCLGISAIQKTGTASCKSSFPSRGSTPSSKLKSLGSPKRAVVGSAHYQ